MNKETKRGLFASTLLAGLAFGAPALAQQAEPAAPATEAEADTIIVTGSRIPQANLVTTSPVTQITAEDITTAGVTRVEDLTNQLPQVFAAQGANTSNGATGTAQVNLRGLGAVRNLVLINGRRMPYGSPNSAPSDLNQIPGALVERVEVMTGGASAVYGSDAITGVVNFIMKDDFEGFRVDGQYGFYQHTNDSDDGYIRQVIAGRAATNPAEYKLPDDDVVDGYSKEVSLIFGASTPDSRGNITAYLSYRSNDAVLQRDRDYSACAIGNPSTAAVAGVPTGAVHWTCGGSATSFPGYFYYGFSTGAPGDVTPQTINLATGQFVPFTPNNVYNFGPLNYYQRPDERYSGGAFAHYEINKHAEVYAELMFSDYRSVAQIAPSGDFFNTTSINCGNPLLPSNISTPNASGDVLCTPTQIANNDTVSLYIARRNVEGGGRQDDLNYQSLRTVIGIKGELTEGWEYDLSAARSRVSLARTYLNDFSITRLGRALNVVDVGGVPTCQSVVDGTDPACVPWNIFSAGGVTPAALNYLQIPLLQRGETIQQNIVATIAGELPVKSPGASSGLAAVFGTEYRRDELNSTVDSNFQSGDGAGQGGPTNPLSGHTDVWELFTEVRLPLLEDQPFAKLLSVDAAYRYSDYNSGTTTDTYKVGAEWSPVEDIRFRGSFQHAVRAPNIIELFASQGAGLFNLGFDPCDGGPNRPPNTGTPPTQCFGANPWQVTLAQSNGTGLNNPAGQYNAVFGGNPNLEPEEADSVTLGFVFSPSFVPGLTLSVDYWDIDLTNAIAAPAQAIVANCYYGNDLNSCALITRNSQGRLRNNAQGVTAINTNIGGFQTNGWDINVDYGFDVGKYGNLDFQLIGTLVKELVTDVGGGTTFPAFDCVGKWGNASVCGTPTPEWRHRARVSWSTPWNLELNATWRHFGEVQRETVVPFPGTLVAPTGNNVIGSTWDAQNYFDFAGNWQVFDNTNIRFGVNNILDEDPPIGTNTNTSNGNTFPQVYDSLGRYFFVGATLDF